MLIILIFWTLVAAKANPILNGRDVGKAYKKDHTTIIENPEKYPFIVHLKLTEVRFEKNHIAVTRVYTCGGSLIARDVVVTAGHCLAYSINEPSVSATAGVVHTILEDGQYALMNNYLLHDDFIDHTDNKYLQNDIALIWLNKRFKLTPKVQLAKLAKSSVGMIDRQVLVPGWGITTDGYNSDMLQECELNIISNKDCKELHGPVEVTPSMLCALSESGKAVQCAGDSGGPLVYNGVIHGISSWTQAKRIKRSDGKVIVSCNPLYPGVFTRVSRYLTWIETNLSLGPPKYTGHLDNAEKNSLEVRRRKESCSSWNSENCIILR